MFCKNSAKPFGWACNHFQGLCCFYCVSQLFVDIFCHLFVDFANCRYEKPIKGKQVSPRTRRCRLCKGEESSESYKDNYNSFSCVFFSLLPYRLILLAIGVVVTLRISHPVLVSFFSLNMCNSIIYCFRNKTALRKACTELLKRKCTNFNED